MDGEETFQTAETGNRTPNSGVECSVLTTTLGPPPIAVADRFTRTEIAYVQATLTPFEKLRDVVYNIRVPLYILRCGGGGGEGAW